MLSYCLTSAATFSCLPLPRTSFFFFSHSKNPKLLLQKPISSRKPNTSSFICLSIGIEQIAEIAQNKVLVAAFVSAAIGQLSKPFTSALLYGDDVDFKAVIRAGGFPSTHSAGVVAAATSLGLERGFADSIFGMTVVFASIVMYDAQGVRREVGKHAKVLNRKLLQTQKNSIPNWDEDDLVDSKLGTSSLNSESIAPVLSLSEKASSNTANTTNPPHFRSENRMSRSSPMPPGLTVDGEEVSDIANNSSIPLKESIGHTETEVTAGALLGFLVSLAVYTII